MLVSGSMTHKGRTSRDHRRRQLVEAAQRVLSRDGLRGLTTREVTAEAGSSLASLHYAFDSVDEMLENVLAATLATFREELLRDVPITDSLGDAIEDCLHRLWAVVVADRELQLQQYELTLHFVRRSGSALGAAQYRGYVSIVEDYLNAAVQGGVRNKPVVRSIARLMTAGVDGLILQHLVEPDEARSASDLALLRTSLTTLEFPPSDQAIGAS